MNTVQFEVRDRSLNSLATKTSPVFKPENLGKKTRQRYPPVRAHKTPMTLLTYLKDSDHYPSGGMCAGLPTKSIKTEERYSDSQMSSSRQEATTD